MARLSLNSIDIQNCGRADNFGSLLAQLIMKADKSNLIKLYKGFPLEVIATLSYWKKTRVMGRNGFENIISILKEEDDKNDNPIG